VHTEFHGVALFFVLSGYLMSRVCDRSAIAFALDRFWRVVPSYWLATALLLTVFNMWKHWPAEHVVLSALFIPHQSPAGLYPVLGVGWTLNLEMYFYAIFTISILINRKLAPLTAGLIISAIYFAVPFVSVNEAVLHYLAHKYVWFFVIGIGIWYFSEWLKDKFSGARLPISTLPVSIALYMLATVLLGSKGYSVSEIYWSAIISVPALFLIAILSANFGADLKPRGILVLGDASYACYLLHTILIEFLRHQGIATSGTLLYTTGVLVASWSFAILWHLYIEKIISMLRRQNVRTSTQAV
jgi:exopolysaccharide production protein ExoZ